MAQTMFPKRIFEDTKRLNPYWSDYTCFAEIIKGKKYLKQPTIKKWFNILVENDDYAQDDKGEVLGFLYRLARQEKE